MLLFSILILLFICLVSIYMLILIIVIVSNEILSQFIDRFIVLVNL